MKFNLFRFSVEDHRASKQFVSYSLLSLVFLKVNYVFVLASHNPVDIQGRTGGKKWPGSYCQTGPLNTRRAAHSVHGALPTQYTARCPFNASHVSTSQWPTWKNTHTLNITLDDYKEITSYIYIFYNIWIHQFGHTGWTHGIKLYWLL